MWGCFCAVLCLGDASLLSRVREGRPRSRRRDGSKQGGNSLMPWRGRIRFHYCPVCWRPRGPNAHCSIAHHSALNPYGSMDAQRKRDRGRGLSANIIPILTLKNVALLGYYYCPDGTALNK
ncbi:hypothetical protein C8Q69DRAFT_260522 [Paecilomyces variotii]|uniref:Secreted protein n=1 Tax=Byssochlamys spectabilis TaxID=264951 RepID=A0A443HUW2_BYSSP|nr:hypothetical protein C8Q69DRAFT_260522 [Paecilomyces variotii]RWQ95615.1 hypothetical protein C8Q69DRAFT_260522 [Paecilomyces variotii]